MTFKSSSISGSHMQVWGLTEHFYLQNTQTIARVGNSSVLDFLALGR